MTMGENTGKYVQKWGHKIGYFKKSGQWFAICEKFLPISEKKPVSICHIIELQIIDKVYKTPEEDKKMLKSAQ